MTMHTSLPARDLVLLGLGHTNAHLLRMWRMTPIEGVRLTCVSDFSIATYSGMLPGTLAGLYPPDRMTIDLVRLCAAARARFIQAEVTGLDHDRRQLLCSDRPAIPFDVLSIGIGSLPKGLPRQSEAAVVPIKPMQSFLQRLDRRLHALAQSWNGIHSVSSVSDPSGRDTSERNEFRSTNRPIEIAVVGAGAGGVEIALCLPGHLARRWPGRQFRLAVIDRGDEILPGATPGAVRLARREFGRRGVEILLNRPVDREADGQIVFADGSQKPTDLVIWSTGAAAPELLSRLELPADEHGFLLTRATLQTTADAPIFVVGDCGACAEQPRPKAGVYAVRQGPILWQNVRRMFRGEALVGYQPQRGFLSLMATGDGRAILSYKGLAAHGRWCWRVKDYIDGRFVDKYQDYRPQTMSQVAPAQPLAAPRCAGCGSKVGSSVLAKVLSRLDVPPSEHVLLGLEASDDAAVIRPVEGRPVVATVDFFPAFLDDPYFVGRVAALNALSDIFALGGRPLAALAMVTIPPGSQRQQEQLLYELLSGGLRELRAAGATLAGGHTTEGEQLTIGYTVLADSGSAGPRLKSGLRPGDKLVLTKPLGSGILLAAHMRAACRAAWMETLVATLLTSNQPAAQTAAEFDVTGMTDITGFGLAGHLLEMLRASNVAAAIDLEAIPLMPGVVELASQAIESTLAPANRAAEAEIERRSHRNSTAEAEARYAALFDPQTSGGLLLGLRPSEVGAFLSRLAEQYDLRSVVIGEVIENVADHRRLQVRPS